MFPCFLENCSMSTLFIFWKRILKSHLWDGSCYQVLFLHKTYKIKPLHQNKKENYRQNDKLLLNQYPKELRRPHRQLSYLWRTYDKRCWNTNQQHSFFEFLGHGYSLYYTNCSQNIIILESKIQKYSTQIQELKKEICSLNSTV